MNWFYHRVMHSKVKYKHANSETPDQPGSALFAQTYLSECLTGIPQLSLLNVACYGSDVSEQTNVLKAWLHIANIIIKKIVMKIKLC